MIVFLPSVCRCTVLDLGTSQIRKTYTL